jgi:hypothetical protein
MKKIYPLLLAALLVIAGRQNLKAQCPPIPVPYFEGFFGFTANNQLPPCWAASSLGSGCLTFTTPQAAAFSSTASSVNYFYTGGLLLNAGVTYSASLWHQTSPNSTNWTSISLLVGSSQSSTGLVSIASAVPGTTFYSALGNTFAVSTSGTYYIAVSAVSSGPSPSQAVYWDDLSVIVPCNLAVNQPTVTITPNNSTVCASQQGFTLSAAGADSYTWNTGSTSSTETITPTVNMSIFVSGTSTLTGCTATATATLTVKPSPNVAVFVIPPVICAGKCATITSFGASSYTWSGGSGGATSTAVVCPSVTTIYTVTGTGTNNCSSTSSVVVSVIQNPTVTASASQTLICRFEPITLTGSGAMNYFWSPSSLNLTSTTVFTVTGTDANGCQDTDTIRVKVDVCEGIGMSEEVISTIIAFPSPCANYLSVKAKGGLILSRIRILDATGRLVLEQILDTNAKSIDVSSLTAGVYFLHWQAENRKGVAKFVKE